MRAPLHFDESVSLTSPTSNEWLVTLRDEMGSMAKNQVRKFVDLSLGHKTIVNKWVFKI